MRINPVLTIIGLATTSILALPLGAAGEIVGTMTALQTKISGSSGKNLDVGAKISLGDQLSSNKTGLGMIVFNDESSAKIGPNSILTIDDFVYQPGRSSGKVAVNMKRGLVRFYGGQISKSGKMQVTTPHIVLGIRGGILDTEVNGSTTKSILRAGRMSCSVNGQSQTITKPGFSCTSDGNTLKVELAKDDDMDMLDSQDKIAGNGVPGALGNGLNSKGVCISGRHDASGLCKSMNGRLPGLTGKPRRNINPLQPLGSEIQEEPLPVKEIIIIPKVVINVVVPTPTPAPTSPTCPAVTAKKKQRKNNAKTSTFAFAAPSAGISALIEPVPNKLGINEPLSVAAAIVVTPGCP